MPPKIKLKMGKKVAAKKNPPKPVAAPKKPPKPVKVVKKKAVEKPAVKKPVDQVKVEPEPADEDSSEPRVQNQWWIIKGRASGDFVLVAKCPRETESLKLNGESHIRILSLGREKPELWCRKPSYLRVTFEFSNGSNKTALLRSQNMFLSHLSHKPFHGAVLNRNPTSIVKFINICESTFDEVQVPDTVLPPTAPPQNKENSEPVPDVIGADQNGEIHVEPIENKAQVASAATDRDNFVTPKPKKQPGRNNSEPIPVDSPELPQADEIPQLTTNTRTRKKDKVTGFGNGDVSDFEGEDEFKDPKLQRDIANAVHKLTRERKKDRYAEDNAKFQAQMACFEGGTVSGSVGYMKSIHDSPDDDEELKRIFSLYPQRSMIDRPLDRHHVQQTEENAMNFRHLTLHGNNFLAIYFGTVKEFKTASKKANAHVDSLRKRGIAIGLDTKQTADFGNMLIIGGTHRLQAYRNIRKAHNDNVTEVTEKYGKFITRVMVTVYCITSLDDEGDVIKLTPFDMSRLARSHNRPAPCFPKSYFDYLMNFRHMMFVKAGMPDADLSTDLPSWWTRAFTQEVYNQFIEAEFPTPATSSDRSQFNKAKDVVELSGEAFSHMMWIYSETREVVAEFMELKPSSSKSKDGSLPALNFPQIIDVTHVAGPLTGLNDEARETVVRLFRDFVANRLQVIRQRKVGVVSEISVLQNVLVKKCEKIKKRQIFLMGFASRAGCADFESLTERFPDFTQRQKFDSLLDENVHRFKKNAVSADMPKRWQVFYDRAISLADEPSVKTVPSGKGEKHGTTGGEILRESMFGAVVLLDKLDISKAFKIKPSDVKFTGVSTIIFTNLSKMDTGHVLLDKIHTNLAQNNDYTLICFNDTVADLAKFTEHYGYVAFQLYVVTGKTPKIPPIDNRITSLFGFVEPFSYITLLCCFRDGIGPERARKKIVPSLAPRCSTLFTEFSQIYHPDLLKILLDRITHADGWILDCAAVDSDDFICTAKATLSLNKTLHVFIWTPPERLFDEHDKRGFEDLINDHMHKAQMEGGIAVDEALQVAYAKKKLTLTDETPPAANVPAPRTKNSTAPIARRSESPEVEFIGISQAAAALQTFSPVSSQWQINGCSTLGLQMIEANEFIVEKSVSPISSLIPDEIQDVPADGNCLFSVISQVLTGDPYNSTRMRTMVCDFLKENENDRFYQDLLDGERVKQYIKRMYKPCIDALDRAGWGGHVELTVFSHILNTDIWTFMADEPNQSWWKYKARTQISDPYEAIYLQNENSHYTLVMSTVPRNDTVSDGKASDGELEQESESSVPCSSRQVKSIEMKSPGVQPASSVQVEQKKDETTCNSRRVQAASSVQVEQKKDETSNSRVKTTEKSPDVQQTSPAKVEQNGDDESSNSRVKTTEKSPDVQQTSPAKVEQNDDDERSNSRVKTTEKSPDVQQTSPAKVEQNDDDERNVGVAQNDGDEDDEDDVIESSFLERSPKPSSTFDIPLVQQSMLGSAHEDSTASETPTAVRETINQLRLARHLKGEISLATDTAILLNTPLVGGPRKHMQSTPVTTTDLTCSTDVLTMSTAALQDTDDLFISPCAKKSRMAEAEQETDLARMQDNNGSSDRDEDQNKLNDAAMESVEVENKDGTEREVTPESDETKSSDTNWSEGQKSTDSLDQMSGLLDETGL